MSETVTPPSPEQANDQSQMTEETAATEPQISHPYEGETFATTWVFDHPAISRGLRTTFNVITLGRAVFINILLLMIAFIGVQQFFSGGRLAFESENVSFANSIFLVFTFIEVCFISFFMPMSYFGVIYTERKEKCFDQVVLSGVSPIRFLFGRGLLTLAFFGVVLLSALPFFVLCVVMRGPTLLDVVEFYFVTVVYMFALVSLSSFSVIALDDTFAPFIYGLMLPLCAIVGGLAKKSPPGFAALSPLRHVTLKNAEFMQTLGLGVLQEPTIYGIELPCSLLSCMIYCFGALFAISYVLVGPDIELIPGLNSFDSVATGRKGKIVSDQKLLTSTLMRTLQIRFYYENLSDRLKAWAPFIRVLGAVAFVFFGHMYFLGALWPAAESKSFGWPEKKFVGGYLLFAMIASGILAIVGGQARSALRDRRTVISLGSLKLGRFSSLFGVFILGMAIPPVLWLSARFLTGYDTSQLPLDKVYWLYLMIVIYSTFIFCLSIFFAQITSNAYSATGQTLLVVAAFNILPFVWIIYFYANGTGESLSSILDLSPILAALDVVRPEKTLAFSAKRDGQPFFHHYNPSVMPFLTVFPTLALVFVGIALKLAFKQRAEWDAELESEQKEREAILSTKVATTAAALFLGFSLFAADANAQAPDPVDEQPTARFTFKLTQGFADVAGRRGFTPLRLSIDNAGETVAATIEVNLPDGKPITKFTGTLRGSGATTEFQSLVPGRRLYPSTLQVRVINEAGDLVTDAEVNHPSLSRRAILLTIDKTRSQPFDLSRLSNPRRFRSRKSRDGNKKRAWHPAIIRANEAPRSALAYGSTESVLLGDTEDRLDSQQSQALADWVARGGNLFVCVGDRGQALRKSALAKHFSPGVFDCIVDQAPRRNLPASAIEAILKPGDTEPVPALAVLDPNVRGAEVLVESGNTPIVIQVPFASGKVTLLAFDFWAKPFANNAASAKYLDKLLPEDRTIETRARWLFPVLTTIQSSQAQIAPAFLGLLIYAFVAGPLVYFGLQAKKKGLLAWILVPVTSIVFTAFAPLYGLLLKETASAYYGITLIESFQGSNKALQTTDMLIFSGGRESHKINVRRKNAQAFTVMPRPRRGSSLQALVNQGNSYEATILDKAFVKNDERRHLPVNPLKIAMWGSRYLSVEDTIENPVRVNTTIGLLGDSNLIRIDNKSEFDLSDVVLVYPELRVGGVGVSRFSIEKLEAGASFEKTIKLSESDEESRNREVYDLMVEALIKERLQAQVSEFKAFLIARVALLSTAENISTDNQLEMNSFVTIIASEAKVELPESVPYSLSKVAVSDSVLNTVERDGVTEVEASRLFAISYPGNLISDKANLESVDLEITTERELENENIALFNIRTRKWDALKDLQIEKLPGEPKKQVKVIRLKSTDAYFDPESATLKLRWLHKRLKQDNLRNALIIRMKAQLKRSK